MISNCNSRRKRDNGSIVALHVLTRNRFNGSTGVIVKWEKELLLILTPIEINPLDLPRAICMGPTIVIVPSTLF